MFTGIVSAVAKVTEMRDNRLGVDHAWVAKHLKIGGSIAVNGCCLTVVQKKGPVFHLDVVPETRRRTNLGALAVGHEVNLELPLTAGAPLDGHLVLGHIDAAAKVLAITKVAAGREATFELPAAISRYIATKGSIAVDGISLTVAAVDRPAGTFKVALIPHTLEVTIAGQYKRGSVVNLEADLLARYAGRILQRT